MYQRLYQNERVQRLLLQTRAQQSLQLLCDNRLAVMSLRKTDFDQTGAKVPDTENLINIPLQIASVEVALLLVEPLDCGPIRVSLRSKGSVDVARFRGAIWRRRACRRGGIEIGRRSGGGAAHNRRGHDADARSGGARAREP